VVSFTSRSRRGRSGRAAAPLSDRVKDIARDPSRKIEAIQAHREETGAGLAEAKDAVESYINGL
jgi:ribosomal protein L7/L12